MTDTRQELLKSLERSTSDLERWAQNQGLTLDDLCLKFIEILRENGIAAQMILDRAKQFISVPVEKEITPDDLIKALEAIRARDITAAIPDGELASPEQRIELERNIKDALPNLRDGLLETAQAGPQHRRGGRPEVLADPELRRQIRDEIKARRDAGSKLNDIYKQIGRKYQVSVTKIKQVWLENRQEKPSR